MKYYPTTYILKLLTRFIILFSAILLTKSLIQAQEIELLDQLYPIPDTLTPGAHFGHSVAIDLDYAVIGCPGENQNKGCVYVLRYQDEIWHKVATLTSSDGLLGDQFGYTVSISGSTIVVGTRNQENPRPVYIFTKPDLEWVSMTETATLNSSNRFLDSFGKAVHISGNTILVSAIDDSKRGEVYVYTKPGSSWISMTETAILTSTNRTYYDNFGFSICSTEDVIIVGAIRAGQNSGIVYLYKKPDTGWSSMTESVKLTTSNGGDLSLYGVSISIGNDLIAVGSPLDDIDESGGGATYLYKKPASGWTDMTETAILTPSFRSFYDAFGQSISIYENTVVVGANYAGTNGGAAFVFEEPTTGWSSITETATFSSNLECEHHSFGKSVDIYGNNIIVGTAANCCGVESGAVHIFTKNNVNWASSSESSVVFPNPLLNSEEYRYGQSVSIDSSYAVVGAPGYNGGMGTAFILHFDGDNWNTIAQLTASTIRPGDNFGSLVEISENTIVVTSRTLRGIYEVYVYTKPTDGWTDMSETALLTPSTFGSNFGCSISLSDQTIAVGSSNSTIFLYERPEDGWKNMTEAAILTASDNYGSHNSECMVAVSKETVLLSTDCGSNHPWVCKSIYIYEKPISGWTDMTETARLQASSNDLHPIQFSSISMDRNTVVAGAEYHDEQGAAFLFEKPRTGWDSISSETIILKASDGAEYDKFGHSVSISGNKVAIGAYGKNDLGNSSGAVYVFEKKVDGWKDSTEASTIVPYNGLDNDYFGFAISLSNNTLSVGAHGNDETDIESGSIYIYELIYPIIISNQPNAFYHSFQDSTICIRISGDNILTYQWQIFEDNLKSFTNVIENEFYSGSKTASLTIQADSSLHNSIYRCLILNSRYSGVSNTSTLLIDGMQADTISGINHTYSNHSNIETFPNPTNHHINFKSEVKIDVLEIYRISGERILVHENFRTLNTVDISNFHPGTYLVKLTIGDNVVTRKIIKQ